MFVQWLVEHSTRLVERGIEGPLGFSAARNSLADSPPEVVPKRMERMEDREEEEKGKEALE